MSDFWRKLSRSIDRHLSKCTFNHKIPISHEESHESNETNHSQSTKNLFKIHIQAKYGSFMFFQDQKRFWRGKARQQPRVVNNLSQRELFYERYHASYMCIQYMCALFLASLRFCVHYCIDHDTVPKKKNCASRGFCVGLSTPNLKMIWKQTTNKQTWLISRCGRWWRIQTHTHIHTHTHTHTHTHKRSHTLIRSRQPATTSTAITSNAASLDGCSKKKTKSRSWNNRCAQGRVSESRVCSAAWYDWYHMWIFASYTLISEQTNLDSI